MVSNERPQCLQLHTIGKRTYEEGREERGESGQKKTGVKRGERTGQGQSELFTKCTHQKVFDEVICDPLQGM